MQLESSVAGASAGQNPACTGANPGVISNTVAIPAPAPPTAGQLANLATLPGLGFVAEATNFKNALIQQFNLQLEQQFGANVLTIGYVGNIGQHLPESIDNINQPLPFNVITNAAGAARPLDATFIAANPAQTSSNLGGVSYLASEGVSNYSGLQASFQRRFTKGFAVDANYTWAKALTDISSYSQQGDQGWAHALPTNIRATEYGPADTDLQNRFALSFNYELQYGKEFTGIKKLALSGWQTNMIAQWQSGKVFSIENGGGIQSPTNNDTALEADNQIHSYGNRAVPQNAGGNDRPNTISDPRLGHKTLTAFFNTASFVPQPLGTIGNTQRNSMFGPHFRDVDLSLFKNFAVAERATVQFRVEAFNISNTPNFFIANNNSSNAQLGNANFGAITQTDPNYNPREYQFVLKVLF